MQRLISYVQGYLILYNPLVQVQFSIPLVLKYMVIFELWFIYPKLYFLLSGFVITLLWVSKSLYSQGLHKLVFELGSKNQIIFSLFSLFKFFFAYILFLFFFVSCFTLVWVFFLLSNLCYWVFL